MKQFFEGQTVFTAAKNFSGKPYAKRWTYAGTTTSGGHLLITRYGEQKTEHNADLILSGHEQRESGLPLE